MMNIERDFRTATDDGIPDDDDESDMIFNGVMMVLIIVLAIFFAGFFTGRALASPQGKDQRVIGTSDVGTMVRPESKRCKYRPQGSTFAPVLVCKKVKA